MRTSHDLVYRLLPSMSNVPSTSLTILADEFYDVDYGVCDCLIPSRRFTY